MQINKRQEGRNNKIDRKTKTNTSLLTIMTEIKKKSNKKDRWKRRQEDKQVDRKKDIYLDTEKKESQISRRSHYWAGANGNKDCINIWMEIDQSAHCMSFTSSVNVIH